MKNYIKLNQTDEYLSLGNIFRIIKCNSRNKRGALQTDLFCTIFNISEINDTTVNNYCVGARTIGDDYKQIFLNYKKRYSTDNTIFYDTFISIINSMEGVVYTPTDKLSFINNNLSMQELCKKLVNIAKNDTEINHERINLFNDLLSNNDYYSLFADILFFAILEHRQPIYETDLKKEVLEQVLEDSSISVKELQEYLSLKLKEGIHYEYSLKNLAAKNNTYANFELGSNEYYGYTKGYPRYDIAYKYLNAAKKRGHAPSIYMIGTMYLKGYIGSINSDDLETAYKNFVDAAKLGNVAALNSIGNMHYNGIYPLKKDINKALEFYEEAAKREYAYAYNNLGKYYESILDYDKAYEYFIKSALLKESWACNKVGEYLRLGVIKDTKEPFYYYLDAIDSNSNTTCYYAYYNLAKFYYSKGYKDIILVKDINKAIEYYEIASKHNIIESSLELLSIYINKYIEDEQELYISKIKEYLDCIETNPKYNKDYKEKVLNMLRKLDENDKNKLINAIINM